MTYNQVIAKRIEYYKKQRGLTLHGLSKLCGVSYSTLQNIVRNGKRGPELRTIHRLAVGLGISVSEFLDFPEMNETVFDNE